LKLKRRQNVKIS